MNVTTETTQKILSLSYRLKDSCTESESVAVLGSPGDLVSTACMALLRLGTAYLPVDSSYPLERIEYILRDSHSRVVLADSSVSDHLAEQLVGQYEVIRLIPDHITHTLNPTTTNQAADESNTGGSPWDTVGLKSDDTRAAYFIYTSGSTGFPKGIRVTRGNLWSQLTWLQDSDHLGPDVKILQKTPIGFDAAQWELLAPLCGAETAGVSAGENRDPDALIRAVRNEHINSLQVVPTMLQALIEVGGLENARSLRSIYCGGEVLSRRLVQDLRAVRPDITLVNLYGPSECTINASAYVLSPGARLDKLPGDTIPLGTPVDRTSFHIAACPDGVQAPTGTGDAHAHTVGELWISGSQVTDGYVRRPEETKQRFILHEGKRFYKTGDLVKRDHTGLYWFLGRLDNQVKIRGNRVELDELSARYAAHPWVSRAACLTVPRGQGRGVELVAAIQLDTQSAPLMDGTSAAKHHRTKSNKLQVKAQLSNPGLRRDLMAPTTNLEDDPVLEWLESMVYRRKSYRHFRPGAGSVEDITAMHRCMRDDSAMPCGPLAGHDGNASRVLRSCLLAVSGRQNPERLLPKYAYASPGSLYSLQTYVEVPSTTGVGSEILYYHPLKRTLHKVSTRDSLRQTPRVHIISKTSAISDVYQRNVREVQYFELGHYLGAVDDALRGSGFKRTFHQAEDSSFQEAESNGDLYLGSYELLLSSETAAEAEAVHRPAKLFISVLKDGGTLEAGSYTVDVEGSIDSISPQTLQRHEVIAINQAVYDRATYAVGLYFDDGPESPLLDYSALGLALHRLQSGCRELGFMSSGYGSFTGHPLPAALRVQQLIGSTSPEDGFPVYVALCGHVTKEQRRHRGMDEDSVHMQGPAEIITSELRRFVPDYMVPDRTVLIEELPTTPHGKVDISQLREMDDVRHPAYSSNGRPPETDTERLLQQVWSSVLHVPDISADDDFFALGGDSIKVMMAISRLQRDHNITVLPQTVFENPILEDLSNAINTAQGSSRVVQLFPGAAGKHEQTGVVMWPGLGGIPFRLTKLAEELHSEAPVFGVQASGINPSEPLLSDIADMTRADVELLPDSRGYHLVGYSFGCRAAYSAAATLEKSGETVLSLSLVCPGNPTLQIEGVTQSGRRDNSMSNPEFLAILLSIFDESLDAESFQQARGEVSNTEDAARFLAKRHSGFDFHQILRIVRLVQQTYAFDFNLDDLESYRIHCPILVVKAEGDQYSSVDTLLTRSGIEHELHHVDCDHYEILRAPHVATLGRIIRHFQLNSESSTTMEGAP